MNHKFTHRYICILVGAFCVSGCEKTDFEKAQETETKKMEWLLKASPYDDFDKAIRNKDYRFMGVYGITYTVPGVSKDCVNMETDVNFIKGTSEVLIGYEHAKLNAIAGAYAQDYNARMRFYLEENRNFECDS